MYVASRLSAPALDLLSAVAAAPAYRTPQPGTFPESVFRNASVARPIYPAWYYGERVHGAQWVGDVPPPSVPAPKKDWTGPAILLVGGLLLLGAMRLGGGRGWS